MENSKKKVFTILGPTSSGKTSLALKLCQKYHGEIISADSRQVYKYMDVGTGKIPVNTSAKISKHEKFWEVNNVKIWGYDLIDPNQYYSAYDFAQFALGKIPQILSSGKKAFLVGGTGFYIDMVTGRIQPDGTPPDFELRAELEQLPLEELQKRLKRLDTKQFKKIDQKNSARLVRAIEKLLTTKKPSPPLPYLKNLEYKILGLTAARETLYLRVDNWLEEVWEHGLLEETKNLLDSKYKDSPKLQGLVYKTAAAFLQGKIPEKEAKQRTKYDLHAYIRRQQTYFKKMPGVHWLDISQNIAQDKKLETIYNILDG